MNWLTYRTLAMRTKNNAIADNEQWQVAVDGMAGETLEYWMLLGLIDVTRFNAADFEALKRLHPAPPRADRIKELGDIAWYAATMDTHAPVYLVNEPEREIDKDWPWLSEPQLPWMDAIIVLLEQRKKHLWQGHPLNWELIQQAGRSILQMVSDEAHALGISPEEILDTNITKLQARYPLQFTSELSLNRNE